MENKECRLKVHFFYVTLILVLAIILLITRQWGPNDEVAKLISFGVTLTSLFLSLIAIIYSIFSSSGFTKSINDLHDASKNISTTVVQRLSEATSSMEEKIVSLAPKIEALTKEQQKVSDFLLKSQGPSSSAHDASISPEDIHRFLKGSSYWGLFALYAAKLSLEKSKSFELKKFTSGSGDEYMWGFLISCYAFGIISFNRADEVFTIASLNETVKKEIHGSLHVRLKSLVRDSTEAEKASYEAEIRALEDYFK